MGVMFEISTGVTFVLMPVVTFEITVGIMTVFMPFNAPGNGLDVTLDVTFDVTLGATEGVTFDMIVGIIGLIQGVGGEAVCYNHTEWVYNETQKWNGGFFEESN